MAHAKARRMCNSRQANDVFYSEIEETFDWPLFKLTKTAWKENEEKL